MLRKSPLPRQGIILFSVSLWLARSSNAVALRTQVEEIVDVGTFDPDQIHVPGVYVKRIFKAPHLEKRIEVCYALCPSLSGSVCGG